MAQSVNLRSVRPRPELGVKPTSRLNARTSQFDPEQTSDFDKSVTTSAIICKHVLEIVTGSPRTSPNGLAIP